MPTIGRAGPYRFYFFANEGDEPRHVHVQRGDALAKFWLEPAALFSSVSFSAPGLDPRAVEVEITEDELTVVLLVGRRLSVPLIWFPKLRKASPKQRSNFELLGGGIGIHWPDIDEDLSVQGLFRGVRAPGGSPHPT